MADIHPAGSLYFIALVPPQPLFDRAWEIKQYFAEEYNSRAGLKSPPHVTLHMPFRLKDRKLERLIDGLKETVSEINSFELSLNGFAAFAPRVIYIDVEKTAPLTRLYQLIRKQMQEILHAENADWKNRGFTPHMTVAFRDLKRARFEEAWKEFRNKPFSGKWDVHEVSLLKHNGKKWEAFKQFSLNQS